MQREVHCAKYSLAEVASHKTKSDCWVVLHGIVYDVTEFLDQHPGGVSALCKEGRAGNDITLPFERIGHSENAKALLKNLQVGILDNDETEELDTGEETRLLSSTELESGEALNEQEHAIMWHAKRRRDIMRDHPEVQNLFGSNPVTSIIGLLTVIVHCYTCIYVQRPDVSWLFMLFLAASVGAVCKMYQFAVNHDICHGTAGSWLEKHDVFKRSAMQILTLPSIGGSMHTYYEFQHIGHHSGLGTQSVNEVKGHDTWHSSTENGGNFLESDGKESEPEVYTEQSLRRLMFFPDGDGDLFAVGTLSLGKILIHWGSPTGAMSYRRYLGDGIMDDFHNWVVLKALTVQAGHFFHHLLMTLVMLQVILFPPFLSLPVFLFPNYTAHVVLSFLRSKFGKLREEFSKECEELLVTESIKLFSSVAVHVYLWVGLAWWLLYGRIDGSNGEIFNIWSCAKGYVYLHLSDLFLYGFCFHPFMGYFLGVHRSRGHGFESNKKSDPVDGIATPSDDGGCQPTMSTYSYWAAVFSMNLTHHVEHHDFPMVPWNRLPQVTKLAPEYYENLEQSPGFCSTIYRWFFHSKGWTYACQ